MTRPPKHPRYQDYVIRDGRLIAEFEDMYRDYEDPWRQSEQDDNPDLAVMTSLANRIASTFGAKRLLEVGSGLGQVAHAFHRQGFDVTGLDIAPSATEKARARYPGIRFETAGISDHAVIRECRPDIIVMSQITWYVLDDLRGFLDFLKRDLTDTFLIHALVCYPPGVQQYGRQYFTDLQGILSYFGMAYLETGEIAKPGAEIRTWFLGTWRDSNLTRWQAASAGGTTQS